MPPKQTGELRLPARAALAVERVAEDAQVGMVYRNPAAELAIVSPEPDQLFRWFKRLASTRRIIRGKIESPVCNAEDPR